MIEPRWVVFGGAGFIGTHLVRELLRRGAREVVVADIREPEARFLRVTYLRCDVRRPIPAGIVSGPAAVVNLAAIHRTPGHPDHEYFGTNVPGARNVTRFCEETGSTSLWFTSSIAVYGPSEVPVTEQGVPAPVSAYGRSKLRAEEIHRAWADALPERRLVTVRPAVVFGAGEGGNFTKLARALQRGFFAFPGGRHTVKACGYVEDLVASLFFMADQPERIKLYNYCYPQRCTIEEICRAFEGLGGCGRPLGTIPPPLLMGAARICRLLDRIGLRNGIHPERVMKLMRSTNIVPGELVARGYRYRTDLREGLSRWLADEPAGRFI